MNYTVHTVLADAENSHTVCRCDNLRLYISRRVSITKKKKKKEIYIPVHQ